MRWLALHAFADTFNGYYKNGTEGTRDYRYFAGLYLTFRIVLLLTLLAVIIPYYWMLLMICCAVMSLLFAILRPYKNNWINVWDSVVFALLAFSLLWLMYIGTIPFIYIIVYALYKHTNTFKFFCWYFSEEVQASRIQTTFTKC